MGACIVLTPIIIAAWPALAAAAASAAASMGFSIIGQTQDLSQSRQARQPARTSIEADVPNSEVIQENLAEGQKVVIEREGVRLEIGRNAAGACTVCASGQGSEKKLRQIAQEVAGRVVQQFAYHKLMTELKKRNYQIVEERVLEDQSIRVRVREL